jgi:cation:H+ antiporter
MLIWAEFLLCAAMIAVAGVYLCRYGDAIARATGMGGTWVGLILLASVTSLPELVTGISAVTGADTPNIAIGDVLGSAVVNLAMLVVLDIVRRTESVYLLVDRGHIISAAFGLSLLGLVAFGLLFEHVGSPPPIAHVGWSSPVIMFVYLLGMHTVFQYEKRRMAAYLITTDPRDATIDLGQAIRRYAAAAMAVLAAGAWLPFVSADLADSMGWERSFVGTILVAAATSMPELVVTITAVRMGALDMAIGGLLGSNMYDVLIVAIDDVFYLSGPVLRDVSLAHVFSALSAIMMSGIFIVGMVYRPSGRVLGTVGWASIFLTVIFLVNSIVLFLHGD